MNGRLLFLKTIGVISSCFYLGWNLSYLALGKIPSSIFKEFTGLPCPTTGGTRSFRCLLEGDLAGYFFYNPMTLPILMLFVLSVATASSNLISHGKLRISSRYVTAWSLVLAVAWIIKLSSSSATW